MLINDYAYLKKQLYKKGINIENRFEYNNSIYSLNYLLDELHLLPIHLTNFNYLVYTDAYCESKANIFREHTNAFLSTYGQEAYQYIVNYIFFLSEFYDTKFKTYKLCLT